MFGAGGQLGVELVAEFGRQGYEVHGFTRQQIDIGNLASVESALTGLDPGLVLNAAAYNMVDLAESQPEEAYRANGLAPRNLATVCRQLDAKLVHYSTDYVFDGEQRQPYREDDAPHPLGAYAVSKLAGEFYARAYLDNALIMRVAVVCGPGGRQTARGNFVETMLKKAGEGKPLLVVNDQTATPTYAPQIAIRTRELVQRQVSGVVHCGGEHAVTFYDYARMIFAAAGVEVPVEPVSSRVFRTPARRPSYSALDNARMRKLGLPKMPPLEECLADYLRQR